MKFSLIFCLLITICLSKSFGQDLINSSKTSYYTYIYKLTENEAKDVITNKKWSFHNSLLHTPIDSFRTHKRFEKELPAGHYFNLYSHKNKQIFEYFAITNFDIEILNNSTDLNVQLFDLNGDVIIDAIVKTGNRKLRYNRNTKTYYHKKSNRKGTLTVKWRGHTNYYELNRQLNNSWLRRSLRTIGYKTPVKYIWQPVKFIAYLPIDGTKSIIHNYQIGTIRLTTNFISNTYDHVACNLFNSSWHCNFNYRDNPGYFVFNKPKYLPGDTVKLKAFLTRENGRPIDKPLDLILYAPDKRIKITQLNPYRAGAFEYNFFIHDSLGLQLDRNYRIVLSSNKKTYKTGWFRYEDYELSKLQIELRAEKQIHHINEEQIIFVRGTDENDLNILDGRLNVIVSPNKINSFLTDHIFIPDTLLYKTIQLDPSQETRIHIPDSIIPKVNMDYDVHIELLTSDNQSVSSSETIKYFHTKRGFEMSLINDSLLIEYKIDGHPLNVKSVIYGYDNFGNPTRISKIKTPHKIELNPFYANYTANLHDKESELINISNESSLIQCYSERSKDSLKITVSNPRNLEFNYFLFKGNRIIQNGYTNTLNLSKKTRTKKNYFFTLNYIWGGEIKEESYKIPTYDKQLNIEISNPQLVYPGQEVEIELRVTDYANNPVENVDITAFGLTSKFDYTPPQLPYFGKTSKDRAFINQFNVNSASSVAPEKILDYQQWRLLAGIDSIEYYKFLYPENEIYKYGYYTEDFKTQFAPFVVSNEGDLLPVHIIYVNARPVYFSWANQVQPYSFNISPGYNQITLRTHNKTITIDSLRIENGKKLILSINENIQQRNIRIKETSDKLSNHEIGSLANLMFPYRNTFYGNIAYIQTNTGIQILNDINNQHPRQNFAGPVSGNFTFKQLNHYTSQLEHEQGFQYDFSPRLVKMRSYNSSNLIPSKLTDIYHHKNFSDLVHTEFNILSRWNKEQLRLKRLRANNFIPDHNISGNARLQLSIIQENPEKSVTPLNTIIKKYDDPFFLHIYHNRTSIGNLKEGLYQIILFYPDSRYYIKDSVRIYNNGLNYYKVNLPDTLKKDDFSFTIANLIEQNLYAPENTLNQEKEIITDFSSAYFQAFPIIGGKTVEGFVYDNDMGDPLPGVTVMVEGTNLGTVTNIDGYYSLIVPHTYSYLSFQYIGFDQERVSTDLGSRIDIHLTSSAFHLDEVVVIGYGVSRRQEITASTTTMSSSQRAHYSNLPELLSGTVPGVIFGNNTTGSPLIIINGQVYTGDISNLNPKTFSSTNVLKGEEATALYGASGANGVVVITTKDALYRLQTPIDGKGDHFDEAFIQNAMQSSSIRQNFSDYAFWEPRLNTNKNGVATFAAIFPDDITSWETYFLAMNHRKQSGQSKGFIKSFKPLMGQLSVPRFLIQSDTTNIIGRTLNYMLDSVKVLTSFKINELDSLSLPYRYCKSILIDTLQIVAQQSDSLKIEYSLKTEMDYYDGEIRTIPVFPLGMEETVGSFHVLNNDTTITVTFNAEIDSAYIYAHADMLNILQSEANHIISYRYNCNEQIASRIKALLMIKKIAELNNEEFKKEKQLLNQIDILQKNIGRNGLWGWWKNSEPEYWISLHVVEALIDAEQSGYKIQIDTQTLTQRFILELDKTLNFNHKLRILKAIRKLDSQINIKTEIESLKLPYHHTLNQKLLLNEFKQSNGYSIDTDWLNPYENHTIFGNVYYNDTIRTYHILNNRIQNTLLAYKIIRNQKQPDQELLNLIRNYLLERRGSGYWRNTYESCLILETILPDLIKNNGKIKEPKIVFHGNIDSTVTEFPFEYKLSNTSDLSIEKSGTFPIYFTAYQTFWNKQPTKNSNSFKIETRLNNAPENLLTAGVETSLMIDVVVEADAEYVMLNIPIPGGCSYGERIQGGWPEVHREYFRNETVIFFRTLRKGEYTFEVNLIPRFTGIYNLNPAKIELMYFPTFNGNNEIKQVIITN